MIILDTDIVSLVQRADSAEGLRVRGRIAQLPPAEIAGTTVVTYEEQVQGWFAAMSQARKSANRVEREIEVYARLAQHVANYRKTLLIPYDRVAATRFEQLKALKLRMGSNDMRIAAIALAQNAKLITRNLADFARVPELRVEDWTKA